MKYKILLLIIVFLFGLAYAVTPYEAVYLQQEYSWMLLLNLIEVGLFSFGLILGIFVGEGK